ncbi:Metallo-dependent phosphatase [Schizopora paradoxa]|uniref:Metallo-dependent phosphatase n=1 Tax=Schizopora paradoxa TaxID=27342 RepID=A0A0H2RSG6_9AGAM|nr:Metallo-dependent phosphatase [Schizopora paradoxa]
MPDVELPILHFNDVYRVSKQKLSPTVTIDVTQFAAMIDDIRETWRRREDGKRDGLVLFSGDLFSPSVESSVTRGSHLVPVINELGPDVSVTGNHDFDFGYPHLTNLLKDTNFPWLLSNVVDTDTSTVPAGLHEYFVLERAGVRIGFIGLIEKDWIATIPSWPSNFKYKDMKVVGLELSKRLRDPAGEHHCDLIVALTHARVPNDIQLAKDLYALSPSYQAESSSFVNEQGVDLILGGHDHLYYASKGVSAWDNYDTTQPALGAEKDNGDVLVAKSGTDFRDLSEILLTLSDTPAGSIRKRVIKAIKGKRHTTLPDYRSSPKLTELLSKLLDSVSKTMKAPVCRTMVPLDVRSEMIRLQESAAGNWFADVIRHAYDDAVCMDGGGGCDAAFICAGTLRGDTVYGPGVITLGEILEILPFEDSIVIIEMDGNAIWDALESSLSKWPAQEGRFPAVSGLNVIWDSRKPPGERVLNVMLQLQDIKGKKALGYDSGYTTPTTAEYEGIKRDDKKYKIMTREYMSEGHDGFDVMKKCKYIVDGEQGQMMSSIVRKYLLGADYIKKMCRPTTDVPTHLNKMTDHMISHAKKRAQRKATSSRAREHWRFAMDEIRQQVRSAMQYQAPFRVVEREHMSGIDCFDGSRARAEKGGEEPSLRKDDEGSGKVDPDLLVIDPVVDGRLKDVGRSIFQLD